MNSFFDQTNLIFNYQLFELVGVWRKRVNVFSWSDIDIWAIHWISLSEFQLSRYAKSQWKTYKAQSCPSSFLMAPQNVPKVFCKDSSQSLYLSIIDWITIVAALLIWSDKKITCISLSFSEKVNFIQIIYARQIAQTCTSETLTFLSRIVVAFSDVLNVTVRVHEECWIH